MLRTLLVCAQHALVFTVLGSSCKINDDVVSQPAEHGRRDSSSTNSFLWNHNYEGSSTKGYPQLKCSYHQYHDICIYSAHIHFFEALLYSICYMKCPLLLESTEVGLSNHHQLRRSKHIPFNAIKCRCDTIDVMVLAMASNVRLHLS